MSKTKDKDLWWREWVEDDVGPDKICEIAQSKGFRAAIEMLDRHYREALLGVIDKTAGYWLDEHELYSAYDDLFIVLFKKGKSIRNLVYFSYSVARTKGLDWRRKKARQEAKEKLFTCLDDHDPERDYSSSVVEQVFERIKELVRSWNYPRQEIAQSYFFSENRSLDAVANELELSRGRVRSEVDKIRLEFNNLIDEGGVF